jgi:hypothetical protein
VLQKILRNLIINPFAGAGAMRNKENNLRLHPQIACATVLATMVTKRAKVSTGHVDEPTPLVSDASLGRLLKTVYSVALPGFGQYLDGEYKDGMLHTVAGVAAGAAFGPIGLWLVGANSVSRSRSGRNLWERASHSDDANSEGNE